MPTDKKGDLSPVELLNLGVQLKDLFGQKQSYSYAEAEGTMGLPTTNLGSLMLREKKKQESQLEYDQRMEKLKGENPLQYARELKSPLGTPKYPVAQSPLYGLMLDPFIRGPRGYEKTGVPGESELMARVVGIPEIEENSPYHTEISVVNMLKGASNKNVTPIEGFEGLGLKTSGKAITPMRGKGEFLGHKYNKSYKGKVGDISNRRQAFPQYSLAMSYYSKAESPLKEISRNTFNPNVGTRLGKNLQDRIDIAYGRARSRNIYITDPHSGKRILPSEEPLLGDVHFNPDGSFEDKWDFSLDPGEDPSTFINKMRTSFVKDYVKNIPVVKGKVSKEMYDRAANLSKIAYDKKAREMRPVVRDNTQLPNWQSSMKDESSHLWSQSDNEVFPMLFPVDPSNPSRDPRTWIEYDKSNWRDALKLARVRNEVMEFDTEKEAKLFARTWSSGNWLKK